jgi:hypothetical protein
MIRPLQQPRPLWVEADLTGRPLALRRLGWQQPRVVRRIQDRWRIDEEWWRDQPISRLYHRVLLADGTLWTIYHDLLTDAWFEQSDREAYG